MGRPIKKSYFGSGDGSQLRVRAKIGAAAEGNGSIISQKGSKRYLVNIAGAIGICTLVAKADGTLAAGEMSIEVVTDAGAVAKVTKLYSRAAIINGVKTPWTFTVSNTDAKVQVSDAVDPFAIVIATAPAAVTVVAPAAASFSVVATPIAGYTFKYRWQVSVDAGATWTNVASSGVYSGATAASLAISDTTGLNGHQYRVAVSATGLTTVTSAAALLTA